MNKRSIIIFLAALIVLLGCIDIQAEDYYGRESLFLMGAGARAMGMGGAFTAVSNDGSSVFYNPAGLGFLEYRELTVFNTSLYENTNYTFGSFTFPILGLGAFGISGIRLGTDNIVFRDRLGVLSENDYSIGQYWMSYGIKLFDFVSIGTNLKFLNQSLGSYSSSSGSFDLALLANYRNKLFFGVNAQDILAGELKLGSTGDDIRYNIKGGLAYKHNFQNIGMLLALDIDKTEDMTHRFHFGAEFNIHEYIFARAGYDRTEMTLGAGLKYRLLAFDYAYKANTEFGGSHRMGLSFFFGPTISQQKARRVEKISSTVREKAAEERQIQLTHALNKADEFYRSEVWDSAAFYYNNVLAHDPENVTAINRLRDISDKTASATQIEIDTRAGQIAYDQLLEKYSTNADSLFKAGEYESARLEYRKILQLDSTNQAAQDQLEQIRVVFNRMAADHISRGESLLNQERFAEAVVEFNEAQKLQPENNQIGRRITYAKNRMMIAQKLKLAVESLNSGDTSRAVVTFQEILELEPNEQIANDYLQKIQTQADLRPVTIVELKADEEIWNVYLDGLRFFSDGQYEEAIEQWEIVLDKYPGSADTRENLRQARLRMGENNR